MTHNFNNVFEAEDCEVDKVDFYKNCTFLKSLGRYRKGDKVKSIYIEHDGTIVIDGEEREYFTPDSYSGSGCSIL
jgi:hypothetical protein